MNKHILNIGRLTTKQNMPTNVFNNCATMFSINLPIIISRSAAQYDFRNAGNYNFSNAANFVISRNISWQI